MIGFIAVMSVIVGRFVRWDTLPESGTPLLIPEEVMLSMENDEGLSEDERAWMRELNTLEMPRRHIVC